MNMRIDSIEFVDSRHTDIDQQQLKKQSDQAKRFVNPAIKDHPQLDYIKGALQVLHPKKLISVLESTQNAINGSGGKIDATYQDIPALAKPDTAECACTDSALARMTQLLGKITQLSSDNSLQNQLSQLKSYNASMAGAENSYSELAEALESQGEQWACDSDALKAAQTESGKLEKEAKSAEFGLQNAQTTLAKLEAEAQDKEPVPPELSEQIDEAKKAVLAAQTAVDKTALAFNRHRVNVLNPAIHAENSSKTALDNTLTQSRAMTDSMSTQKQTTIENQRTQNNQKSKSLTFLIALMSQLIDTSASNDLKAAAELKTKLSEAAAKDAEKKSQEYEDSVRKSEEMQKVMGCIGKVLGWVITAVSFAAAAFTGGASLAFAAIGLALTVGDEINQAVNGFSFMAEALKPLMEAVIQPMMELLGKVFAQILESFGLDKSTAEMIGQIMGAIAAAIIMVAAVTVAGSAANKLSGMAMKNFGSKVMDKVLNNVVGDMMKRIGQGLGRSFGMQEAKIARVSNYTNMGVTGASMANTSIQTAGNIITAEMRVNAAKAKAQLLNSVALQSLLNEMLDRAVETFKTRIDSTNTIVKNISTVADSKLQAGKYITKKMSAVAG